MDNFINFLPSLILAAEKLKGSERRMFLGQIAMDIGYGGQKLVSETLGISRETLRKGMEEAKRGIAEQDMFSERGRKPLEELNPGLIQAIKEIIDGASQTDPSLKALDYTHD